MLKNRICACLLVALLLAAMLPVSVAAAGALPSGDPAYKDNTFVGVSPLGTTINLFDYWLTEQTASDRENPNNFEDRGINQGHALLFGDGIGDMQDNYGDWNKWTGNVSPRTGIVDSRLGEDGYPVLNLNISGTAIDGRDGRESLAYLFDPDRSHDGKAVYEDVQNLLQIDTDGYYSYNSRSNYAVFYKDTKSFLLYDHPGVMSGGAAGTRGQFFPFNAVNKYSWNGTLYNSGMTSIDGSINHYFGVHMSTRFVQQDGGYIDDGQTKKPVIYEFSGDDDVWVFIDGVLVADLGGIHNEASLSIDFATGVITINGESQDKKLGDLLNTGSATLPNDTYHTLDFFYLERGNVDSNMSLKYNLVYVPESNIYKIDQNGEPLLGSEFKLCKAERQSDGSYAASDEVLAEGTTDAEGRIILLDENGDLLTIQKLIDEHPDLTGKTTALILKETGSPPGYRSSGDLELYFYQPTSQTDSPPFLLSRNHWQTGAHAVARLTATTEENIEYTDGKAEFKAKFKPEDHLMFAVVFKNVKGQWRPISGSPATGWTVAENNSWESIREANLYRFVLSSSGSYTAMIDELPGDVKKYVEAVGEEGSYRIDYYFSNQKDPQAINGTNTYEITSDMNRVAAVNLYVPNIRNDLTVQKLDQNGNLITGGSAIFELLPADQGGTYNPPPQTTVNGVATFTAIPNGTYYLVETDAPAGYTANATQVKVIVNDTGVYANAGTAEDGISVERGVGRLVNSMAQFASKNTVDTTLNQIVAKFYTTETEIHEDFQWRKIEGSGDKAAFSPVGDVVYHPAYSVKETPLQDAQWYLFGTAPGSATPVGMHLAHLTNHSGDICDGLYQTTVTLEGGGPGITAQETDTGWSALLVEQCKLHTRHSGTPSTDLTGDNLTDLTALFTGDVTVKVKNDPIVGNLAVQKTVAGNAGETGREWKFTIELNNADAPLSGNFYYEVGSIVTGVDQPKDGTLTFDNDGKATISLKHGQKITIEGIPVNATYTVTETEADGYVTTPDGGTIRGEIQANKTATAAFTNTKNVYQRLTVEKTVEGTDGDKKKAWEFTIELKNADGMALNGNFDYKGESIEGVDQPTGGTLTFGNDGKATIRLKHGQKITIENIPVNVTYTVTETEADEDDYVTAPDGGAASGEIKAGADATASFINSKTILRGDLTVTKTVAGNAGETDREWEFTIELKNANGTALSGDFHYKKGGSIEGVDQPPDDTLKFDSAGKATIHLKHGQKITIEGIPVNATYTVTETEANQDGYTTNPAKGKHTGTIEANKTATAAFTNTKNVYGGLTVTKTVAGNAGDTDREWNFTVTLGDKGISGTYGDMSFTGGKATFTLKHNQTMTAKDLPAGISYTVTEDKADDYVTTPDGGTIRGEIQANKTATAAFTNTKNVYGGLTVTKTVAGNAGDKDRKWNFTVTLSDTGISGTYGDMSFTGGKATFTLKHNQTMTAKDLPAGIDYFVSEAEASQDGYTTRATGASGRIPAEGTATAAFTNMKSIPRGNLSVSKTVSGSNPPSKTAFGFTVILSDRTVDGRFGEMTFRSGVAEFTLRHGETVTASGLPAGVGYLVQEEANEAYTVSSEGAEGLIEPDGTATARFVNRRVVLPPKTGDDSHTGLWLVLMTLSLCCAALLAGLRKRGGRAGR